MKPILVAATAVNQTPLDWRANLARLRAVLQEAKSAGAAVVCLPELCITGYGCEDAFLASNTHRRAWAGLKDLLPETSGMVVSFGLPVFHQNTVFNAAALAVDGQLIALVCKQNLAGDGIHYEPRWFKPWPRGVRDVFRAPDDGAAIPIGDLLVDVGGLRIGFEICEDAWVADRPGAGLALLAVDLILNPSASHFAFGKREIRRRFVLEGSRAFGVGYLYSNLLGNEAGRAIYDGQTLIAAAGECRAEGERFSFAAYRVTTALLDPQRTRLAQARTASHRVHLPAGTHPNLLRVPFEWRGPSVHRPLTSPTPKWEMASNLKAEEFTRAVALGLFDYLRKTSTPKPPVAGLFSAEDLRWNLKN